jgi:hypothetical protein
MTTDTKTITDDTDRPPTVAEAQKWYKQGYVTDDGLEQLIETSMEAYGLSGRPTRPQHADRVHIEDTDNQPPIFPLLLIGVGVGVLITIGLISAEPGILEWLFGWEIHRPGVVPI